MRTGIVLTAAVGRLAVTSVGHSQPREQHVVVQGLTKSATRSDGTHSLSFSLADGSQLTLDVPKDQTLRIMSALSAPTGDGASKQEVVAVVQRMAIGADEKGTSVIMIPLSVVGPLQALAIPVSGAEQFIQLFQQRLGEARAKAAAQAKPK